MHVQSRLGLKGAVVLENVPHRDGRGFFLRSYCSDELRTILESFTVSQHNISYSAKAGTARGLHFQYPPFAETKVVSVLTGSIQDVILDLRPESTTFGCSVATVLDRPELSLVVPERCAHGFITLESSTLVSYLVNQPYAPEAESGVRLDDPYLDCELAAKIAVRSTKDEQWPDLCDRLDSLRARLTRDMSQG